MGILQGSETILFVDDEDAIVQTGQEALEIHRKEKEGIDLVILDMVMPGMGGGETHDRLKQINPNINVLLSSGYSLNGRAKRILDRGRRGFIQKPYNFDELARKVRQVLHH
jgi:two-component system cell cycle sensor histidine kinase/response regulator CckA